MKDSDLPAGSKEKKDNHLHSQILGQEFLVVECVIECIVIEIMEPQNTYQLILHCRLFFQSSV